MLRLRPEAERDIWEAAQWYEKREAGLGKEFVTNVDDAFRKIAAGPKRYPVAHHNLRRALLSRFAYAIFFREDKDDLLVVAVLHQRSAREVLVEREG